MSIGRGGCLPLCQPHQALPKVSDSWHDPRDQSPFTRVWFAKIEKVLRFLDDAKELCIQGPTMHEFTCLGSVPYCTPSRGDFIWLILLHLWGRGCFFFSTRNCFLAMASLWLSTCVLKEPIMDGHAMATCPGTSPLRLHYPESLTSGLRLT